MRNLVMNRGCVAGCAALLALTLAGSALAGARDHEDGFFLRLSAGGGSMKSTLESGGDKAEFSGGMGDVNFAIGGIVSPNLALHGTLYGWSASDPDLELSGEGGTVSGAVDGTVTAGALGVGLTYYFMPVNIYVSGTIGGGRMTLDGPGSIDGETDGGLMLDFTLGKEWWVGDGWGLGVAGGLTHHSFPDGGVDENWSGTTFALRFTATMN